MKTFSFIRSFIAVGILGILLLVQPEQHPALQANNSLAQTSSTHNKPTLEQTDHSLWDKLLTKYVDQDGMVDYQTWKDSPADTVALSQYLALLSRASLEMPTSKQGRLAFWINAYNALTVQGILKVYPTSSIRNHTARVIGYNIWHDLPIVVDGKSFSLDFIEHKILRKLDEPRIHFAIVCASISCPRLLNEAYTPANLEAQLTKNSKDFFSRKTNFSADLVNRRIHVSSILDWFGKDFGQTPQQALAALVNYLPHEKERILILSGTFEVSYLEYDWSLNEQ